MAWLKAVISLKEEFVRLPCVGCRKPPSVTNVRQFVVTKEHKLIVNVASKRQCESECKGQRKNFILGRDPNKISRFSFGTQYVS